MGLLIAGLYFHLGKFTILYGIIKMLKSVNVSRLQEMVCRLLINFIISLDAGIDTDLIC